MEGVGYRELGYREREGEEEKRREREGEKEDYFCRTQSHPECQE